MGDVTKCDELSEILGHLNLRSRLQAFLKFYATVGRPYGLEFLFFVKICINTIFPKYRLPFKRKAGKIKLFASSWY